MNLESRAITPILKETATFGDLIRLEKYSLRMDRTVPIRIDLAK